MTSIRTVGIAGLFALASGTAVLTLAPQAAAQEDKRPVFRVKVDMVVLSFTVTVPVCATREIDRVMPLASVVASRPSWTNVIDVVGTGVGHDAWRLRRRPL